MDRQDSKDPLDPKTYNSPATIKSMIELRAFCAAFFEEHIRGSTEATDQALLIKYITFITSSKSFFARARAVIPELQLSVPASTLSKMNPNIQRVLELTEDLRRSPDTEPGKLVEDSAWSKLAKGGLEQRAKQDERLAKESKGHTKQSSGASSSSRPGTPAQSKSATGKDSIGHTKHPASLNSPHHLEQSFAVDLEEKPNTETPRPHPNKPPPSEANISIRPKLSLIPTFIPRNQLGDSSELVWSPTSGTRARRPEERYQSPTHPASNCRTFGQVLSANTRPNVDVPHHLLFSSTKAETPKEGHDRTKSNGSILVETERYRSMPSPLGPNSPSFTRREAGIPSKHRMRNLGNVSTEDLFAFEPALKIATPNQEISESMYETAFGNKQIWKPPPTPSDTAASSRPRVPVSRTRGIHGAEPFSAPPGILGFGDLNISDMGAFGDSGYPSLLPSAGNGSYDGLRSPEFHQLSVGQGVGVGHSPIGRQRLRHDYGRDSSYLPFAHQLDQMQPSRGLESPYAQSHSHPFQPSSIWNLSPPTASAQLPVQTFSSSTPSGEEKDKETLVVPPPGNMTPLDYWNLLHHRSTSLIERLNAAKVPITHTQQFYLDQLHELRIATVANNKMPARGKKSARSWLQVLEKESAGIWEQRPGDMPLTEVVVGRKSDYEEAVKRAITLVTMEIEQIKNA